MVKLSVDQVLMKAISHFKKNWMIKVKKLYKVILQPFSKNLRAQQKLTALKKSNQDNIMQSPPQETIDQLVNLYNQGQLSSVVEQAQAITDQYPEAIIVWNILGASTAQIGMMDEAVNAYKKAISLKPDYADAYSNMGVALKDQGKLDEAIEVYNKCISLKPDYAEAYSNMGVALQEQDKLDEAIEAYNKCISLKPDYADAYNNMGVTLQQQGKLDEAINAYNKAILLNPNYADAYSNMGNVLKDQGKLDEAIEAHEKSILLNPNYVKAYSNMGNVLKDQGKLDESIASYKKALLINPNYAQAHLNLSITLLNNDKLKEGLEEYEWRWKTDKFLSQQRHFTKPLWDGKSSLKGKRVFLWSEQGIGDTLNWSSCLPLITAQAKHCIVECQEKLVPLLGRTFPNVEIKAVDKSLDLQRDDFDIHLPMGSLYKHFLKEIIHNPKPNAFLVPDPVRVNYWKERLKSLGTGPYIGISWKSSVTSAYRLQHYPPISEWSPILKIPDLTFINLQYVNFEDDLKTVQDELEVKVHHFDDLDQYNNVDDVAALCAALDMVVSTKVTPPFISSAVGTSTKFANWKQSSYNIILNNPVTSSFEMYDRNTWEPWDDVFKLIAEDILKSNKN
ncbi:tetratricopeptide repeat protein [Pseudomonadota bacterium]|nr:tetratricopeptide repeat protein [Pseudomonadota bacterium]